MPKRFRRGLESWGHYLLALLCAGVILLSAAWTREQRAGESLDRLAVSDQSQRLSQVTPPPDRETCGRPTAGEIIRGYSDEIVYFPGTRSWQAHRAVDFAAAEGERVRAMLEGIVVSCRDGCVVMRHENGLESSYRGLECIEAEAGQQLRKGAVLGTAGGRVPHEGRGHICVSLTENGVPVPFTIEN